METARGGLWEGAAKDCGMYTAEEKQGDKGKSKQWIVQNAGVWCVVQMGFGAVEKVVYYNARTKGISAWSWAALGGDGLKVFFLTLHPYQEAEKPTTVKRRGMC